MHTEEVLTEVTTQSYLLGKQKSPSEELKCSTEIMNLSFK